MSRIHFISIGGAIMHNLAIELKNHGHQITGSDDIIYDPSKSRLESAGLLPKKFGWFGKHITEEIDFIILGMHAKKDNPELIKAQELGIKVHSFPSYVAELAKDKKRIVVAGSHGKTTTSSMIMHVLKKQGLEFDYLVGAQLDGFQNMVKLSDAPIIVIEGDEYLTSAIDRIPKFLHYLPDIAVITGISWDHINVFPTYDLYKEQFKIFLETMPIGTKCFLDGSDTELVEVLHKANQFCSSRLYKPFQFKDGKVISSTEHFPVSIFGEHNMKNLKAAYHVCQELGISEKDFLNSMSDFKGAAKRQQEIVSNNTQQVFWDFAHAPSKVKATVQAFKENFKNQKIRYILELHTYSSLNKEFLHLYKNVFTDFDEAVLFFNPKNLEIKKMPPLSDSFIKKSFGTKSIKIINTAENIDRYMDKVALLDGITLIMSSGQLGGVDIKGKFDRKNPKKIVNLQPKVTNMSKVLTLRDALKEAMQEEMRRDENVFLMGEEVAEYNGAYKVSKGLLDEFGAKRVIDTPIAELGFAGIGVGAAMNGLRPIVEFMTWNFAVLAFDQIVNNAAKTLSQSAGQFNCPIVFRGPSGSAGQLAQQHSQSFEAWLANCPGLKVISCVDPADSKGLLKSAIRDDDPICFMESEQLYGLKGEVPEGEDNLVPIGKAIVRREGTDVTLVSFNKMMEVCKLAADELAKEDISAEVIDLRTIRPLDHETIVNSVKKTNRLVVVDESWPFAGISAEVAYEVQKYAFDYLDAPVTRINSADTSLPYSSVFVEEYLPNPAKVIKAVKEVMYVKS